MRWLAAQQLPEHSSFQLRGNTQSAALERSSSWLGGGRAGSSSLSFSAVSLQWVATTANRLPPSNPRPSIRCLLSCAGQIGPQSLADSRMETAARHFSICLLFLFILNCFLSHGSVCLFHPPPPLFPTSCSHSHSSPPPLLLLLCLPSHSSLFPGMLTSLPH